MSKVIRRDLEISKKAFLDYLVNHLGYNDLCLAYSFVPSTGELCFSKWVNYLQLMHLDDYDLIPDRTMTKQRFLKRVSHRTILDIEILIDIDDCMLNGVVMFPNIKSKARWICNKLKSQGYEFSCYFTGSKSYHISLILPEMKTMSPGQRRDFKREFLAQYGGEALKSSERCMIALEGEKHYRSGFVKAEVCLI